MHWSNSREQAMNTRRFRSNWTMFALLSGISGLLLAAVFAAGMAIGYHSVYRNVTVASLGMAEPPPGL
jgi:hypothetical protein